MLGLGLLRVSTLESPKLIGIANRIIVTKATLTHVTVCCFVSRDWSPTLRTLWPALRLLNTRNASLALSAITPSETLRRRAPTIDTACAELLKVSHQKTSL